MPNYITTGSELTSIADAIRLKGGTSASLVYPSGFISAIADIPSGGGNADSIINRTISGVYENSTVTVIGDGAFMSCSSLSEASFASCSVIGSIAFKACSNLSNVSFPECVSIGSFAFMSCRQLNNADFPECVSIYEGAFSGCWRLKSASFPKVTDIGANAFSSCSSLTTAYFPSASNIYNYAFYSCFKLTSANFPEVTSISGSAFTGCTQLTSAIFPKCLNFSASVFDGCTNLRSVWFPKCTTIGVLAFRSCASLSSVVFPACTTISNSAFQRCWSLFSLYLTGSTVAYLTSTNAFFSTPMSTSSGGVYGSIFVRASKVTAWKTAQYWSTYANRIVGLEDWEVAEVGAEYRVVTWSEGQYGNLYCDNLNEFITWGEGATDLPLAVTFYDSANNFRFVFDDYIDKGQGAEFYFSSLVEGSLYYSFSVTVGYITMDYELQSAYEDGELVVWMNAY